MDNNLAASSELILDKTKANVESEAGKTGPKFGATNDREKKAVSNPASKLSATDDDGVDAVNEEASTANAIEHAAVTKISGDVS